MKTTTPKPEKRYRWSHPSAWLTEKVDETDVAGLRSIIGELLGVVDGDDIQHLFQSDMEADGYFQDLNAPRDCPDCGTQLTPPVEIQETGALPPNYCTACDRQLWQMGEEPDL